MPGWLTNDLPLIDIITGSERLPLDTYTSGGAAPQTVSAGLLRLSTAFSYFSNYASSTAVSGTRYYHRVVLGSDAVITGIQALIGATGGTDKFIFELHGSTGALVATTTTSGVTVGTANTWQRIAFTTPYSAVAGTYYIAVQLNGTTARFATYNAPSLPTVVGSATGTFGTGAAITPPTTYTAGVGPVALIY